MMKLIHEIFLKFKCEQGNILTLVPSKLIELCLSAQNCLYKPSTREFPDLLTPPQNVVRFAHVFTNFIVLFYQQNLKFRRP